MSVIHFAVNNKPIPVLTKNHEIISIGVLLDEYSELCTKNKRNQALNKANKISTNRQDIIMYLRIILGNGKCDPKDLHHPFKDTVMKNIIMIFESIKVAKDLEINLSVINITDLYSMITKQNLSYHYCLKILDLNSKNSIFTNSKELNQNFQEELNNTEIHAIKEYFQCPKLKELLNFMKYNINKTSGKLLISMIDTINFTENNLTKELAVKNYSDVLNYIIYENSNNPCENFEKNLNYFCLLLEYSKDPNSYVNELFRILFKISPSVRLYCKQLIEETLEKIIELKNWPFTSQKMFAAICTLDNLKPINITVLINNHLELIISAMSVINNENACKIRKIIGRIRYYYSFENEYKFSNYAEEFEIFKIMYQSYKYDTEKIKMNDFDRSLFNKALGINQGLFTKPAIKSAMPKN